MGINEVVVTGVVLVALVALAINYWVKKGENKRVAAMAYRASQIKKPSW